MYQFGHRKLYETQGAQNTARDQLKSDIDKASEKYKELKAKGASSAKLEVAWTAVNDLVREYEAEFKAQD